MANTFECRSTRMSLPTLRLATNRLLVGAVAVEGLALLGSSTWGRCGRCSATSR
jgi:hypothetical protein